MRTIRAGLVGITLMTSAGAALAQDAPAESVAPGMPTQPIAFHIERQPLDHALRAFADQSGLQLLFHVEGVAIPRDLESPELAGSFRPDAALDKLLANSGLSYHFVNSRTVTIRLASTAAPADPSRPDGAIPEGAQKPPFWDRFRVAQVDAAEPPSAVAAAESGSAQRPEASLEEIVVSAQKRMERLQDVPVPVSAISADALVNSNQLRVQDYYTRVPGLGLALIGDGGSPTVTIRGVTTGGFTNPTVGVVIDDVPYGSSTAQGAGFLVPDIDPSDLARIEVLRGPQGTLYGASSIGGLLKFVTVDPSMDALSGRLQAGISSVRNDDELGYTVRGAINVPLGDSFAIRASGFDTRDGGYVDNIQTGEQAVNRRDAEGGRVSALWQPSDVFSVKLSALLQNSERLAADEVYVQPGLADLQQIGPLGTGGYERNSRVYSATLKAKMGQADLVSVTGYSVDKQNTALDFSGVFGGENGFSDITFGVTGASAPVHNSVEKFVQELRLTMSLGPRVDWLLGGFYTREKVLTFADYAAVEPNSGSIVGLMLSGRTPSRFVEHAAFTDITVHITDRFDVQVGGRKSQNEQSFSTTWTGPLVPDFFLSPSPYVQPTLRASDNAFTYLVTPRLKVSPDLTLYARLASGYRPGGPNTCTPNLPCQFSSDETRNYEIGVKGNLPGHALSFDASVYSIDWKDIQLALIKGGLGYTDNAGRARSRGVELSMETKPLRGLTLSAWMAYNDAALTESFPSTANAIGVSGDRLPYSSRISGNVTLEQEFALGSVATGFAGGSMSYLGDRKGMFQKTPLRQEFPSYTQVDLNAGARYDVWTFNAFINNVTDKRGVLRGGLDAFAVTAFTYIQPRTIGVSLARTF